MWSRCLRSSVSLTDHVFIRGTQPSRHLSCAGGVVDGLLLMRQVGAASSPRSHPAVPAPTHGAITTATRAFSDAKPFSRKRPGAAAASAAAGLPGTDFNTRAAAALVQIYRALSPLLPMNDGFKWSSPHSSQVEVLHRVADAYAAAGGTGTSSGSIADTAQSVLAPIAQADTAFAVSLDCGPARGSYLFSVDREQERLNVQSPVSGTFSYVYV
jgi:hypothetical protein